MFAADSVIDLITVINVHLFNCSIVIVFTLFLSVGPVWNCFLVGKARLLLYPVNCFYLKHILCVAFYTIILSKLFHHYICQYLSGSLEWTYVFSRE